MCNSVGHTIIETSTKNGGHAHFGSTVVKTIIPSELYCSNMIILCKLVKIMIVQTSLCKGSFLAVGAV